MSDTDAGWEARVAALWSRAHSLPPGELVKAADALAGELPPDDGRALFERACARDTGGFEAEAEPLYRAALAGGQLDAYRSARASIQLASTLRILGQLEESERLLVAELDRHMAPGHTRALHDEARATLALTYVAQGRAVEAAGLALSALAPRLSRYNRSVAGNAAELVARTWNTPVVAAGPVEPAARLTSGGRPGTGTVANGFEVPAIGPASADDAGAMLELQLRAFEPEGRLGGMRDIPPLTETLEAIAAHIREHTALVARHDGRVIGSIRGIMDGTSCRIRGLGIDPAHQGRGIGSALLRALEAALPGVARFELTTSQVMKGNVPFYERHGYRVDELTPVSENITLAQMSKTVVPKPA